MYSSLFIVCVAVAGIQVDVRPIAGPTVRGELEEISSAAVVIKTEDGSQRLQAADLWELTPQAVVEEASAEPSVWIRLSDGSALHAHGFSASAGMANISLTSGQTIKARTRIIDSVRFRNHALEHRLGEQWEAIASDRHDGDTIVIRRRESLDHLSGVIRDVSDSVVQFEFDGDEIEVKLDKLDGLVYFHPVNTELPPRLCRVTDHAGSQWSVRSLNMSGEEVQLTTVAGVRVSQPLTRIRRIDFSSGNIAWLSELEAESVQWRPFVDSKLPAELLARLFYPQRDAGFGGQPLMLGGMSYGKGLAIRSRTEIVYRLTEDFRLFHAIVGIDDRVRQAGDVRLVIHGDDRELYAAQVTGCDEPIPLDLDVTGVKRLRILVDFSNGLDVADELNLCDARLTK